eukprot:gb/GEZJ01005618.1/.p4 GENE.gb/GEZJ01005618.1/~~gb/GEZJ01005618.1/.p4  ORF type:complete len:102 (+),score=11.72 gb/GEZJ01005618.1/:2304-2609(+)
MFLVERITLVANYAPSIIVCTKLMHANHRNGGRSGRVQSSDEGEIRYREVALGQAILTPTDVMVSMGCEFSRKATNLRGEPDTFCDGRLQKKGLQLLFVLK